jgi:hypothetical protein
MINAEKFGDTLVVDFQFGQIDIVHPRQPADGRFDRAAAAFATIDDPFKDPHVVAETGPEKFSIGAFAEPVHIENQRRLGQAFSDVHPVLKIIADAVSAEWQHRHRVATDLTDGAGRGGRCF